MTVPYPDTSSISFSAMFFFTSKYSWVSLCPVLARTSHELNKQTNIVLTQISRPDEQPTNRTEGHPSNTTAKVYKWTRNQETREKLNLNQKSSLGKANEIENTKRHCSDFPWLVHDEENNTMKSKICCSFPEIADKSSSLFIGNGALRCTTI